MTSQDEYRSLRKLFFVTAIVFFLCIVLISIFYVGEKVSVVKSVYDCQCDACDMRFNKDDGLGINGVYAHPNYFCVWTNNRTPEAVAQTTFHEISHYYLKHDPEHFEVKK